MPQTESEHLQFFLYQLSVSLKKKGLISVGLVFRFHSSVGLQVQLIINNTIELTEQVYKFSIRIMDSMASCFCLMKRAGHPPGFKEHSILASETPFTVNEVEALYILYEKLSSSIIDDGLIHKEEFQLALLNSSNKQNFFADRLFDVFDIEHNGVIEFGEFVRSLSIFHPKAPEAEKISFAFRLYDLRRTGYIEQDELKVMVSALLRESDLTFPDDVIDAIVDKTIMEADLKGDGRIDPEEWREMVAKRPSIIKNMTLPHLKEITLAFPSFVMSTQVRDSELFS